jgi:hypothetical protein
MTEKVTEGLSKLSNEEIHNLCYSLNTVIVIELVRQMSGCAARSGERWNACRTLIKELRKFISLEHLQRNIEDEH